MNLNKIFISSKKEVIQIKIVDLDSYRDIKISKKNTAEKQKKRAVFNLAIEELRKQNGIDYRKLLLGDTKEKQRLKDALHKDFMKQLNKEDGQ